MRLPPAELLADPLLPPLVQLLVVTVLLPPLSLPLPLPLPLLLRTTSIGVAALAALALAPAVALAASSSSTLSLPSDPSEPLLRAPPYPLASAAPLSLPVGVS
jgi:hypothetical protein